MTKKDIEQIKQYKLEIKMLETQITKLREMYSSSGSGLGDGMPHARSTTSKTERLAVQVYELSQKLVDLRSSLFILVKNAIDFVYTIPDSTTRMIVKYKCIDGMKLTEIAEIMGVDRTTVSKKYNAFMDTIL